MKTSSETVRLGISFLKSFFQLSARVAGVLSQGVRVDLMRELASRLGVPVDFVVHATPGEMADDSTKGTWDVAILAIEQSHAKTITFSPPITKIEASHLVHKDLALRSVG